MALASFINNEQVLPIKNSNDKDYLEDNPNRRCPNIDKSINELGYNPTINLDEGLIKTFFWYKDNY